MTTTQWIFIVFFAIFWGSVASVQGRWKMFHWPLIKYPHVATRVTLSVLLLNLLPIAFFTFVFFLLRNTPETPTKQWTLSQTFHEVAAGVTPAFANFGFYRLWLAVIEFQPKFFYQCEEKQDAAIKIIEPTQESLNIRPVFAKWNLLFALVYLIVAAGTPWFLIA